MNEINYTQGMWAEMDTTYYNNQYRSYNLFQEITMMAQTFLDRADGVVTIHRPDIMSPRKEVMKHTME